MQPDANTEMGRLLDLSAAAAREADTYRHALRWVVRTYMVDDDAFDMDAETERKMEYVLTQVGANNQGNGPRET